MKASGFFVAFVFLVSVQLSSCKAADSPEKIGHDQVWKVLQEEFQKPPSVTCQTRFVEIFPETSQSLDDWWKTYLPMDSAYHGVGNNADQWEQRLKFYAEHGDKLAARKLLLQLHMDGALGEDGDEYAVHFAMEAPCEYLKAYQAFTPDIRSQFSDLGTANGDDIRKAIAALKNASCPEASDKVRAELIENYGAGFIDSNGNTNAAVLERGEDAPRCAWWSKAWNVDTERIKAVEKKFGPATKWDNGDAICGEENAGYQWKVGKRNYWVVFFEAELGTGIRVSYSLPTAATLGFADTCERPVPEQQMLPKGPFPVLSGAFQTPIPIGTSQSDVLSKLGQPDRQWTSADGTLMMRYSWDCRKCRYNFPHVGELEGVQTYLTVGFRNKKLEHFEFSRAWGL